ncbi:MAG: 2Fe-2S iron-sulfur cluster binding domain-containing protein, partial [Caldilineaceae bacterium]|nr:2Fe-2S iron-sulfur cluster binding domain-containing protein [Caldilineaceae bacterium]
MTSCTVTFEPTHADVTVPVGTLVVEAAQAAGLDLHVPCGGQGRCGRCAVQVDTGVVRRRSSLRLSPDDVARGYALACQTVLEGDASITLLPQEQVVRRL